MAAIWSSLCKRAIEELVNNLRTATTGPILVIGNYQLSVDNLLGQVGDILQNVVTVSTSNPIILFRGVTTGVLTVLYVMVLTFWITEGSAETSTTDH